MIFFSKLFRAIGLALLVGFVSWGMGLALVLVPVASLAPAEWFQSQPDGTLPFGLLIFGVAWALTGLISLCFSIALFIYLLRLVKSGTGDSPAGALSKTVNI